MAKQKLTTEEILAKARQEGAMGAGPTSGSPKTENTEPEAAPAVSGEAESAAAEESAPAAEAPVKKPAAKPSSTADILAAARSQSKGGAEAKPAAAPKSAAKPGSTADILAAARSQGGGAAKKPAAKPGSTADILAAARVGGTGGGAAKAPAKPAAAKTTPKQPAAARPAGDRPSVQEMVSAARAGAPAVSQTAPPKPKLPPRPPLPGKKSEAAVSRRSFFSSAVVWVTEPLMAAWVAMGALAAVWGLLAARFMMPNMIVEPPTRFKIGPPSDYPPGTVSTKWKASRGIWVVNTDQYDNKGILYALLSICTHLGCTPNWLEGEQKFKCPCHGSGFYITGVNFEGPAPRPLERVGLRLSEDGSLEVDKSVKFQEELGQWQDPASFVELA